MARLLSERDIAIEEVAKARSSLTQAAAAAAHQRRPVTTLGKAAPPPPAVSYAPAQAAVRLSPDARVERPGSAPAASTAATARSAAGDNTGAGHAQSRKDDTGVRVGDDNAGGGGRWEQEIVAAQAEMARLGRELKRTQEEQLGASLRARRKEMELQQLRAAAAAGAG